MKDKVASDKFHALIYGDSGSGKTHLLGTFPKVLILDTDNGVDTLSGLDVDVEHWATRVGDADSKEVWKAFLDRVDQFVKNPTHETLALDSLTTLGDMVVAHIVGKQNRTGLQLQDYTPIYDELSKLILKLRRSPTHMILTAHEETTRDEYNAKLIVRPLSIGNQFPKRLPIFFNNIYNVKAERAGNRGSPPERLLLVQPDGTRMAKTQANNNDTEIKKSYASVIEHLTKRE